MATKIGVVRYTDTGEIFRIVYPLDDEPDEVLDDPQWLSANVDESRPRELLKLDAEHVGRVWFGPLPSDLEDQ
jgi:hypothetical protein